MGKIGEKIMIEKEINGVTYVVVQKELWDRMW